MNVSSCCFAWLSRWVTSAVWITASASLKMDPLSPPSSASLSMGSGHWRARRVGYPFGARLFAARTLRQPTSTGEEGGEGEGVGEGEGEGENGKERGGNPNLEEGEEQEDEEEQEEAQTEEEEEKEKSETFKSRGDNFEETTRQSFWRVSHGVLSLQKCGGKGDRGIDLAGQLWEGRVGLLAQCKCSKHRISPKYLREFEGALEGVMRDNRHPIHHLLQSPPVDFQSATPTSIPQQLSSFARDQQKQAEEESNRQDEKNEEANDRSSLLGIFVSSSGFTRESVSYVEHGTRRPLALSVINPTTGELSHFHLNRAAHSLLRHSFRKRLLLAFQYHQSHSTVRKSVTHLSFPDL